MDEKIYLLTRNFKLSYKLKQINISDVQLKHVIDQRDIPLGARVITDKKLQRGEGWNILQLHKNMELIDLKRRVYFFLNGSEQMNDTVYIGIDPGQNIGIAILYNNQVLDTSIVLSHEIMVQWLRQKIQNLKRQDFTFRIGDGVPKISKEIIRVISLEFDHPIEVVDETSTSIKETNQKTIHEQAAVNIAKRSGVHRSNEEDYLKKENE